MDNIYIVPRSVLSSQKKGSLSNFLKHGTLKAKSNFMKVFKKTEYRVAIIMMKMFTQ